ncbi:NAD(P)-dependent alcohol dehydrogenase [Streptomyces sp. CA-249302]|uniref:NAD(P)-dependent alcohol dehydrogenase n=1 Tax=Streptomyces sp. CA-249302 TaxID=3240058 RepID=UPI003D8D1301
MAEAPGMRAVQYDTYGPPEVLRVRTVPLPEVRAGEVLVRAAAASVNAADVTVRSGGLRLLSGRTFPRGTGFDFTGDIIRVGDGAGGFAVGDGVWGFLDGLRARPCAAAAQYVLAPAERLSARPHTLDPVTAAALPGVGAAALGALRDAARLRPGHRVLIRGAAGGVGTAAVQIAHAMGAHVTALARAPHLDAVRELGADDAFDYRTTDPHGLGRFDVILDPVGRDLRSYRRLLTPGGRMIAMIVAGAGQAAYLVASAVHGPRRVRFVQQPPTRRLLTDLATLADTGAVVPVIESIYAMDDIVAAHRSLETGGGFGKRVIRTA